MAGLAGGVGEPISPVPDPSAAPAYCFFRTFEPRPPAAIAFPRHYLLYAVEGAIELHTGERRWTLPPSFAAWVPVATPLTFAIERPMTCCSVLFRPDFVAGLDELDVPASTAVFTVDALAREMLRHARRWGPDAPAGPASTAFFESLLRVAAELACTPVDAWRPIARDERLARAIEYTEANLERELTLAEVVEAAHASERTLVRRYQEEVGLTWAQSLRRARMIRAVELLADAEVPVTRVAIEVGYTSLSSFERAFREFAGDTPTGFRRRREPGADGVRTNVSPSRGAPFDTTFPTETSRT